MKAADKPPSGWPGTSWGGASPERLVSTLFRDATEGVLVVDAGGKVLAANHAAGAMLGMEAARLIGRTECEFLFRCPTRDECPLVAGTGKSRNPDRTFEHVIEDVKGARTIFVSCHHLPPSLECQAAGMVLMRDISSQKATERALIELANRDPLTGLYNRRYFDAFLRDALGTGKPVSLLMIDVDMFKGYNDTHGHRQGDRALTAIARLLVGKTRLRDAVVRYGGEEFAIILPGTGSERACRVAEKLRRAVEAGGKGAADQRAEAGGKGAADQRAEGGEDIALPTISIGVSASRVGEKPNDLIERADRALYAAKGEGRNCVRAIAQLDSPLR
jgi:diguanylate cyclase (GGDEF)-like protein/PAS domain S-box-containing protein